MENWLNEYENNIGKDKQIVENYTVPVSGRGVGFVDAPRGGLSHWMTIKDSKIDNFQPGFPPHLNRDRGMTRTYPAPPKPPSGTPAADPKRPVEILRTIHPLTPHRLFGARH